MGIVVVLLVVLALTNQLVLRRDVHTCIITPDTWDYDKDTHLAFLDMLDVLGHRDKVESALEEHKPEHAQAEVVVWTFKFFSFQQLLVTRLRVGVSE